MQKKLIEAASYLAGMIDGEGTVCHSGYTRRVAITNCDIDLIAATVECCNILGIRAIVRSKKRYSDNHTPCFDVCIERKENLIKVLELVPIRSQAKIEKLKEVVGSYRSRPSPELLRGMYWEGGMSLAEIGAALGWSPSAVNKWMNIDGTPKRRAGRYAEEES